MKNVCLAVAAVAVVLLALSSMRDRDIDALVRERVIGVSGLCVDGMFTTTDTRRGACSNHGGIKAWFDE